MPHLNPKCQQRTFSLNFLWDFAVIPLLDLFKPWNDCFFTVFRKQKHVCLSWDTERKKPGAVRYCELLKLDHNGPMVLKLATQLAQKKDQHFLPRVTHSACAWTYVPPGGRLQQHLGCWTIDGYRLVNFTRQQKQQQVAVKDNNILMTLIA